LSIINTQYIEGIPMYTLLKSLFFFISLFLLLACGSQSNTQEVDTPSTTPKATPAPATGNASIDVLVLYDKEVRDAYADLNARVNHLFAVSNNIYADSGLHITIHPKAILFYDTPNHSEDALDEIARSSNIQSLREQYKADTVLLYQVNPDGEYGQCGVAYGARSYDEVYQFKDAMFAQVEINCPVDSTAHEIGHNMGLLHSHLQNGDNAEPFSYGLGYGVDGQFATIMAYAHNFHTRNQILKFSSPEYECIPGYPCGIPVGQKGEAHATKVLNFTAPKIAPLY